MWTTNFSPDWPEGVANQRRRSQSEGRKSWRKMWEIAVWIKLKWGRLKESGSQTPHWEKTSRVSKPWGRFSALKSERRQCPSLNTKSKSLCAPPVKSSPNIGERWKDLKRHRKCLLVPPPTQQCASNCLNLKCFIWEQPCVSHRLDVMHSEGGGGGLETLFSITFKVFAFLRAAPYVTKVPVEAWW